MKRKEKKKNPNQIPGEKNDFSKDWKQQDQPSINENCFQKSRIHDLKTTIILMNYATLNN